MNKNTFEKFQALIALIIRYFKWIVVLALTLIALTGIYRVDSSEVAVVLRFGRLVGQTSEQQIKKPGLHFALPYIIDEVIKVPVESIQELTVDTHYASGKAIAPSVKSNAYLITGDSNIILIKTVIKYKINDPVAYALSVADNSAVIDGVTSGEVTALIASMNVDDVLTSQRTNISSSLQQNIQAALNQLNVGISISNVELTEVSPPGATTEAFDMVNAASVQKQTRIQEANDYLASKIPDAEAMASEILATAKVNQSEIISKANEEAAQFNGLYEQYSRNPEIIKNSVFRDRISAVLKESGANIMTPESGEGVKIILP